MLAYMCGARRHPPPTSDSGAHAPSPPWSIVFREAWGSLFRCTTTNITNRKTQPLFLEKSKNKWTICLKPGYK